MLTDDLRGAAFRRLLSTGTAITAGQLAQQLDQPIERVRAALDELRAGGRIRVDTRGRITGSAGLSIQPDRHQIELDGRRFWTWCAYDILGIAAALHATGQARSTNPDGETFRLMFHAGRPEPSTLVLFLPEQGCCANLYEQWCPSSNLFHTADAARDWANRSGVAGEVLTLPEAATRGGTAWTPLASAEPSR